MWNLKARFIITAGTHWRSIFAPELGWLHPDYPLLLPLSVVRGWLYTGGTSEVVPIIVALLFTLAIPALLWVGLSRFNRYAGLMGGAFLLGSTRLLSYGASQMADTPLSVYYLGAIILVYLSQLRDRSYLFAAGLFGGFSVWTKNEGFPFVIALFVSTMMWLALKPERRRCFSNILPMLLGLFIVLTGVFYFKLTLAPPNDIVGGQPWFAAVDRLTDLGRYEMIWHHFTENLPDFCGWRIGWLADVFAWYAVLSILLAVVINASWPPAHDHSYYDARDAFAGLFCYISHNAPGYGLASATLPGSPYAPVVASGGVYLFRFSWGRHQESKNIADGFEGLV